MQAPSTPDDDVAAARESGRGSRAIRCSTRFAASDNIRCMTARVAVLASGAGSNLQAILDYFDALGSRRAATVALVASDRAGAGALERARRRDVPAVALDAAQRGAGLASLLASHAIDLIALAGYLRFVPTDVTRAWHGRMVNVHPSLLPAFGGTGMYGMRVHEAVLAAGVRVERRDGALRGRGVRPRPDHRAVAGPRASDRYARDAGRARARRGAPAVSALRWTPWRDGASR